MILSDLIRDVSRDLNDQEPGYEYTRWTVEQLQSYAVEAFGSISNTVKDLFTEAFVVKVEPGGGWQKVCDGCTNIRRIVGVSDAHGNVISTLRRSFDIEENTWPGAVAGKCPVNPKDYSMSGYMISSTNHDMFKVTPPLPPGVTKYLLVECTTTAGSVGLSGDVPDEMVAIIKQWMLYRALSVDSENNPAIIQLAQTHYKVFTDLLQLSILERERRVRDNIRTLPNTTAG